MVVARKVACPRCGKPTEYSPANAFRPFCSSRCKTIDLGDWAQERHRIRVERHDEAEEGEGDERAADAAEG